MKLTIHEAASFMGISLTISVDDLKSRYKDLARTYHPDICKDKDAEEKMKMLNVCFDLLENKVPIKDTYNPSFKSGFTRKPTPEDQQRFEDQVEFDFNQFEFGKFKSNHDFFDKFFERHFEEDTKKTFFGNARNAGKTQQQEGIWRQSNNRDWQKKKGDNTVFVKFNITIDQYYVSQVIKIGDAPPMTVTHDKKFSKAEDAMNYADITIFKDKETQPTSEWTRILDNLEKRKNLTTVKIKRNGVFYCVNIIIGSNSFMFPEQYQTEQEAMDYADINVFSDKARPAPKKDKNSKWKRAQSGNMWRKKDNTTYIVFPKGDGYKYMSIKDEIKNYPDKTFKSEEEAQIFIDNL
jgi:curved DNA-binding protein CbpA